MAEFSRRSSVVGIAIECTVVRVASMVAGELQLSEFPWDPSAPEDVMDLVRGASGNARDIALSVGIGFLEIAKPELPPISPDNLHRVLRRDADRYFPLDGSAAVSVPTRAGIAYATRADALHRWFRALETVARVRAVVAAPTAIERALQFGLRSSGTTTASTIVADAAPEEFGVLQVKDGVIVDTRRIPQGIGLDAQTGALHLERGSLNIQAVTTSGGNQRETSARYAAAIGARELAHASISDMLLDASLQHTLAGRRTRRQWMSYALFAASLFLVVAAASARRTRTLVATEHAVDSLAQLAAPGIASQKQLAQLADEARVLSSRANPSRDPLTVIATLSKSLPADAFIERIAWDGAEWRLDGSANQAASVVPHLDSARSFTDVRVLTASTRFRDGARMRESFSVAFKVKGDSSVRR